MALRAVLDTRFFFALYNPTSHKQEDWCRTVVQEAKRSSFGATYLASCITIAELRENMSSEVGKDVTSLRILSMKNAGIEFVQVNEEIVEQTGDLKLNSGELPMADAIVAATAMLYTGGRLLTDDEHFREIKNLKLSWTE